ncbi:MAG TPA: DUF5668 domain-containing protein [Bryobacteraceae bacterium]|jgi:hypothetical protein|nr:DUF5668 domain-containing protein [Bryobacteraceae bacterium]
MRLYYPGQIALPFILVLAGALFLMGRMDVIHLNGYWNLWPVTLIAAGLEELYLWSVSGAHSPQAVVRDKEQAHSRQWVVRDKEENR